MEEALIRYVRVKPKSGAEKFYRCGMLFTLAWMLLEGLDAATAQRLEEEQMLEVSVDTPVDYEGLDAESNADGTANAEPPTTAATPADAPNPAGETPALHTPPAELDASPVDPVSTTGEGAAVFEAGMLGGGEIYMPDPAVQVQAEAEAIAQVKAETAAEAAPVAPKPQPAKAKK